MKFENFETMILYLRTIAQPIGFTIYGDALTMRIGENEFPIIVQQKTVYCKDDVTPAIDYRMELEWTVSLDGSLTRGCIALTELQEIVKVMEVLEENIELVKKVLKPV